MNHPIIEKNKRFLSVSCSIARFLGSLFLGCSILTIFNLLQFGGYDMEKLSALAWKASIEICLFRGSNYIFYALIAFGVAEFLKYLSDSEYKPRWMLLYADRVLYAYAAFLILKNGYALAMKHNFHIMGILIAVWLGYAVSRILLPIIKKDIALMPQTLSDNILL